MELPVRLKQAVEKSNVIRKDLAFSLKNEEKEILAWLGIKIGDTVDGQESGIAGSLGAPGKYIVTGVKVVQQDFPEYHPGPFVAVSAKKVGNTTKGVTLGRVNGTLCMNVN